MDIEKVKLYLEFCKEHFKDIYMPMCPCCDHYEEPNGCRSANCLKRSRDIAERGADLIRELEKDLES